MGFLGAMSVAGKVAGAAGSIYAGLEKSRSLKAGAKAKKVEARQVREQGVWEQIRLNEQKRRTLATQRALFGEAGVTTAGAPEILMRQTTREFVLDRMMIAKNVAAERKALLADAHELAKAAKAAKTGGILGAFSSFF